MEKPDITKMEQWETSGIQGKKPTKSKKSKEPEPLTKEQLEKLPKLPKDWKWVSHSEISIINPPKPTGDESLEISFLPMPAVEEETGRYSLSETRKLGEVRTGYTGFIEGDVIFAKITPCMENGKVALLEKLVNGIGFGSTEFHVSRPTSNVSGKYLFHYLVQQMFRKEAKRSMTGSAGQLRVSTNYFAEQPFPLAPLPEQRAIVSKIELLFSELDNGISNLKLAQAQLKVYRQAVLKKAFEGELTKKWREQQTDFPDARDLLEQIRTEREEAAKISGKRLKKIEPLKEAELVELPRLPTGWSWTRLGEVTYKIGDVDHKMPKEYPNGIPYVATKDFTDELKIDFSTSKTISKEDYLALSDKIKPEIGDIIFPRYGTIGKNILIDFNKDFLVSYSCAIIKNIPKYMDVKYVYQYLFSPTIKNEIRKYIRETTQANVGIASIELFVFPLCSLSEQFTIIQEIETRLSVCDKIEQDIKENLEKAEALRQSILKKAFEGKLLDERELAEVRGAEDWEPAEVLLERIRAEKTASGKKGRS
ncbi:MAG: restriction endonuclease subunit S [Candidatus Cloacimonetes bacterium]|nr:restriction endonuclease subunit S [Candidatus Cloacimonadota bacterium]